MPQPETPASTTSPTPITRTQYFLLGAGLVVSAVVAFALVQWGAFNAGLLAFLPLTVLGLTLVRWNSHWALCFAAFAIMPLGIVQQELLGVTLNLPEVLILALAAKEGLRFLRRPQLGGLPWIVLLFFVICLSAALLTGLKHGNGIVHVVQDFRQFVEYLVLFGLVLIRPWTRTQLVHVCSAFLFGATLVAIHGLLQQWIPLGISDVQLASDLVLHQGVRSGSFYGATPLGGLMVLALGPAIGLVFLTTNHRQRALLFSAILLCLLAMIFTKTRGSWVGMLVALSFLLIWVRPTRKNLRNVAIAAVVFGVAIGPMVVSRLATLGDPKEDTSLMERAQFYTTAARIGEAHPFFGLGWGCYYDMDEIIQAERYVDTPRPPDAEDATVHSAYLQVFVKTGSVGVFGLLVLLGSWVERLWRVFRTRPHDTKNLALFAGVSAGLTGYLFHSTFENFFQWPVMSQSFWLLLGLSFVTATSLGGTRRYPLVPAAMILAGVGAFIVFMAATVRLEKFHTDHYEENIAHALDNGNLNAALRTAERAVQVRWDDPHANFVYAKTLILSGDLSEARLQLDRAVGIQYPKHRPRVVRTHELYYEALPRLVYGQLEADSGNANEARWHFELARAFADLSTEEFDAFHPILYQNYAEAGIWMRALEFGAPTEADLNNLPIEDVARLAIAAEAMGRWKVVGTAASLLLNHETSGTEGYYLLGRMRLALGEAAAARTHLTAAARGGHALAPYYLGQCLAALDQPAAALNAFLDIPEDNPLYTAARAHGLAIRPDVPDTDTDTDAPLPSMKMLGEQLARGLARMAPLEQLDDAPTAFQTIAAPRGHGGPMLMALLWDKPTTDLTTITGVSISENDQQTVYRLEGAGARLQVQWAVNELIDFSRLPSNTAGQALPGWIDSFHDWFDLHGERQSQLLPTSSGSRHLAVPGMNWFYSAPAYLNSDHLFLLQGKTQATKNTAAIQWQLLNETSDVVDHGKLVDAISAATPTENVVFIRPTAGGQALRVELEAARDATDARFGDLTLLAIAPPLSNTP